jgi:hypothetical protein
LALVRCRNAKGLVADGGELDLEPAILDFLRLADDESQHVGVERPAQALVRGDHDRADVVLDLALHQEGMAILGVRVREVRGDRADLVAVGARVAHALLGLPHLRGGDHLHGLGDLARALHALDLGADFLRAGHRGS